MAGELELFSSENLANIGYDVAASTPSLKAFAEQELASIGAGAAIGAAIGSPTLLAAPIFGAIGAIVGASIPVIGLVFSLLSEGCAFSIRGNFQRCEDYPDRVRQAVSWMQAHPQEALRMDIHQFGNQTGIFYNHDEASHSVGPDAQDMVAKLPTATELLRAVQVPAAAALATTALGGNQQALFAQFPALTGYDEAFIASTKDQHHYLYGGAKSAGAHGGTSAGSLLLGAGLVGAAAVGGYAWYSGQSLTQIFSRIKRAVWR